MNKTWLITGASRGLGRALAEAALDAGHNVVATTRTQKALDDLVARYPDRATAVELDVTDEAACSRVIAATRDLFGGVDVVVNNAGYADMASIEDMPVDVFRAQIDANFYGVVNLTRAALPLMREQGRGHIIQISSVGGRVGGPGLSAYQAAKWAVGGFSEVLAKEVAPFGIKVTVAEPGAMRTDWAGSSMTTWPFQEPYRTTVGAAVDRQRSADGRQAGDPKRVAQILLDIAESEEPPLRLLLGKDAVSVGQYAAETLAAGDAKWRHVSESV
jgi:NAD(P)-dependent dehydrogenase (short-subunit alcohol dehydrogenase family)